MNKIADTLVNNNSSCSQYTNKTQKLRKTICARPKLLLMF